MPRSGGKYQKTEGGKNKQVSNTQPVRRDRQNRAVDPESKSLASGKRAQPAKPASAAKPADQSASEGSAAKSSKKQS